MKRLYEKKLAVVNGGGKGDLTKIPWHNKISKRPRPDPRTKCFDSKCFRFEL